MNKGFLAFLVVIVAIVAALLIFQPWRDDEPDQTTDTVTDPVVPADDGADEPATDDVDESAGSTSDSDTAGTTDSGPDDAVEGPDAPTADDDATTTDEPDTAETDASDLAIESDPDTATTDEQSPDTDTPDDAAVTDDTDTAVEPDTDDAPDSTTEAPDAPPVETTTSDDGDGATEPDGDAAVVEEPDSAIGDDGADAGPEIDAPAEATEPADETGNGPASDDTDASLEQPILETAPVDDGTGSTDGTAVEITENSSEIADPPPDASVDDSQTDIATDSSSDALDSHEEDSVDVMVGDDADPVAEAAVDTVDATAGEDAVADAIAETVVDTVDATAGDDAVADPIADAVDAVAGEDDAADPVAETVVDTVDATAGDDAAADPVAETVVDTAGDDAAADPVAETVADTVDPVVGDDDAVDPIAEAIVDTVDATVGDDDAVDPVAETVVDTDDARAGEDDAADPATATVVDTVDATAGEDDVSDPVADTVIDTVDAIAADDAPVDPVAEAVADAEQIISQPADDMSDQADLSESNGVDTDVAVAEIQDGGDVHITMPDDAPDDGVGNTGPDETDDAGNATVSVTEHTADPVTEDPIGDLAALAPLPDGPAKPDDGGDAVTDQSDTVETPGSVAATTQTPDSPTTDAPSADADPIEPSPGQNATAAAVDALNAPGNTTTTTPDSATARPEDDRAAPGRSVGPDRPNTTGGPAFDVIRVAGDGRMILAGTAAPLATIIVTDGDITLGEEIADIRGDWIFMPIDPLSPGNHQIGAVQKEPNGTLIPSSDLVLVVVPLRGTDIAGRETDRADQPLVMLVPRDGGPATVIVQSPDPDAPLDEGLDGTEVAAADRTEDDERTGGVVFSRPALPGAEANPADADSTARTAENNADGDDISEPVGDLAATETADPPSPFAADANSGGDPSASDEMRGEPDGPITFSRPSASTSEDPGDEQASNDVSLDVIDYDEEGDISFAGDAPAGAIVRVYLDNAALGVTEAAPSGAWQLAPIQTVPPGPHQIRVDQIAPSGDVIARIELPFVRAEPITGLPDDAFVVVQPGNSLWRIARRVYGDGVRYTEILAANKAQIADPNMIYPGQVFMIPHG